MRSVAVSSPELLAAYDGQVRRRPLPDAPGDLVQQDGGVVRVISSAVGAAVRAGLERGTVVPVVAYDGATPVAAARLELNPGTEFARLGFAALATTTPFTWAG